jgi:hypothetical protein
MEFWYSDATIFFSRSFSIDPGLLELQTIEIEVYGGISIFFPGAHLEPHLRPPHGPSGDYFTGHYYLRRFSRADIMIIVDRRLKILEIYMLL